jgi:hypothetical protein
MMMSVHPHISLLLPSSSSPSFFYEEELLIMMMLLFFLITWYFISTYSFKLNASTILVYIIFVYFLLDFSHPFFSKREVKI